MSNFWWLQPGWTETCCANCGQRIWPEGDPDWGVCYRCFTEQWERQNAPSPGRAEPPRSDATEPNKPVDTPPDDPT
jgi:hypothetical protein